LDLQRTPIVGEGIDRGAFSRNALARVLRALIEANESSAQQYAAMGAAPRSQICALWHPGNQPSTSRRSPPACAISRSLAASLWCASAEKTDVGQGKIGEVRRDENCDGEQDRLENESSTNALA